jgi:hypothetical protein
MSTLRKQPGDPTSRDGLHFLFAEPTDPKGHSGNNLNLFYLHGLGNSAIEFVVDLSTQRILRQFKLNAAVPLPPIPRETRKALTLAERDPTIRATLSAHSRSTGTELGPLYPAASVFGGLETSTTVASPVERTCRSDRCLLLDVRNASGVWLLTPGVVIDLTTRSVLPGPSRRQR